MSRHNTLEGRTGAFEIVSRKITDRIAKKDAPKVASDVVRYVKSNSDLYYVLLNTWAGIVIDTTDDLAWSDILYHIHQTDLRSTVSVASETADRVTRGEELLDASNGFLYRLINRSDNTKALLQALRYPKRYSPNSCDILNKQCIQSFLNFNNSRKMLERREYPPILISYIREKIGKALSTYEVDWYQDFDLTPGTVCSTVTGYGYSSLMHKLDCLAIEFPNLYNSPLYPISRAYCDVDNSAVEVFAVPKSYKTARIVARETTKNVGMLTAIRRALIRALKDSGYWSRMDLDDQGINSTRAIEASKDGSLATVDLSQASDSFTHSLLRSILPKSVMADIEKCLASNLYLPDTNKVVPKYIVLTMGSPITMVIQSLFYLVVGDWAAEYFSLFKDRRTRRVQSTTIYGDDCIVDSRICDTFQEALTLLGFKVNDDKTFMNYHELWCYRESCGAEGLLGWDVSQHFFPRKPFSHEDLDALISLQHHIFFSDHAEAFLRQFILGYFPKMTSHSPGTDCADLWSNYPLNPRSRAVPLGYFDDHHNLVQYEIDVEQHPDGEVGMHYVLQVGWPKVIIAPKGVHYDDSLVEMWRYTEFLRKGPRFEDPLMELLGVSTSLTQPKAVELGVARPAWRLVSD